MALLPGSETCSVSTQLAISPSLERRATYPITNTFSTLSMESRMLPLSWPLPYSFSIPREPLTGTFCRTEDYYTDDGHQMAPEHIYEYLSKLMYHRRSESNPLWNKLVVGGFRHGKRYALTHALALAFAIAITITLLHSHPLQILAFVYVKNAPTHCAL